MKKNALLGIGIIIILIVASAGAYFYLNAAFEKKARKQIDNFAKNNNIVKNLSYKDLKASLLTRSVQLKDIEFEVANKDKTTAKIKIKEAIFKGDLNNNYESEFKDASFINMDTNGPIKLIGKTILTAEKGQIKYKKDKGRIEYRFHTEGIKISKDFVKDLQNESKEAEEFLTKILKINNPIKAEGFSIIDTTKKTVDVKKYKMDWENNFSFEYSLSLQNIDIYKLKDMADKLNNKNNQNPLMIFEFFNELGKIKPIKIAFTLKDKGFKERLFDYIKNSDNQTKEQIVSELENKLSNSELKDFKDAIINFVKTDNGKINLTIENPNKLSVSEIIQNANSFEDIQKELKIKLSN